jgi:integrase
MSADVLPTSFFALKTGRRVSEIAGLTWSHIDLENSIVRLEAGETKNNEARTVYLDNELQEILQEQWEARKQAKKLLPCVFPNHNGSDKIKQFRKVWKKACDNAGIGHKLFHDFRRTAVRNMVRSGVPEGVAMRVSGHRTRSVFERYNIVNDADLRLAAQTQEAYLESQMVTKKVTIRNFHEKRESTQNG